MNQAEAKKISRNGTFYFRMIFQLEVKKTIKKTHKHFEVVISKPLYERTHPDLVLRGGSIAGQISQI